MCPTRCPILDSTVCVPFAETFVIWPLIDAFELDPLCICARTKKEEQSFASTSHSLLVMGATESRCEHRYLSSSAKVTQATHLVGIHTIPTAGDHRKDSNFFKLGNIENLRVLQFGYQQVCLYICQTKYTSVTIMGQLLRETNCRACSCTR